MKFLRRQCALIALTLLAFAPPALSGGSHDGDPRFADALAAYDGGRYGAAQQIWRALAATGDAQAMTALAGLYHQGLGIARDAARAAERAARAGDPVARMNLGEMLILGDGTARDTALAWAWLKLAAEDGRSWARDRAAKIWATFNPQTRAQARSRLKALRATLKHGR